MNPSKTLAEQTEDLLYQQIVIEQQYAPGEKLPNEIILSEKLKISRTTLREAMRSLINQGIVEIRRGKGTFVADDIDMYSNTVDLKSLERMKVRLKDLFEMRLIFEPEAAFLACKRASDEEISKIIQLGLYEEELIKKGADRTSADQKFHQAIAKATHNEFMIKLLPLINNAVDIAIKTTPHKQTLSETTRQDHALIMDFLIARDAEGARCAMSTHMLHAMRKLEIRDNEV